MTALYSLGRKVGGRQAGYSGSCAPQRGVWTDQKQKAVNRIVVCLSRTVCRKIMSIGNIGRPGRGQHSTAMRRPRER